MTPGPDLGGARESHCVVKINDNEFLEFGGLPHRTDVYKHNFATGGPPVQIQASLPAGIHAFYCGTVKDDNNNVIDVVVSGG